MQHLKLTVSYFGEKFVGWQFQPNGLSIQECLERAWKKITQEQIRITASGRTDSGVHAYAQICHLKTETQIEFEVLRRAINAHTPEEIEVLLIEKTTPDFHAIRSAIEKTYRYQINWGHPRDVFQIGRSWYIPQRLNVPAMIEAAKLFEGEHDFISFAAANGQAATSIRTIKKLSVEVCDQPPFQNLRIEATADGFLYNMVRTIVGTLVHVGFRNRPPTWVREVIEGKDRRLAGMTAPACGLYLLNVVYDNEKSSVRDDRVDDSSSNR